MKVRDLNERTFVTQLAEGVNDDTEDDVQETKDDNDVECEIKHESPGVVPLPPVCQPQQVTEPPPGSDTLRQRDHNTLPDAVA